MYQPLPDCLTIKKSPIHGLGLFATQKIKKDTELGVILHLGMETSSKSREIIRTPLGGFGNHSDTPNCEKYPSHMGRWEIKAIKDIEPDDEITWEYSLYDVHRPIIP